MKAVVVESPGGLEALVIKDVPAPKPRDDQVLIDVSYSGCNWMDVLVRTGRYPHPVDYPCTPGSDISGVVIDLGDMVDDLNVGDRVIAGPTCGGYAEQCVVSRAEVTKVPVEMPLDVASAFYTQAMTAYHCLHTVYSIQPGDWVLVHAVGGGVGLHITQLAKLAGANVIGTVGTAGKETLPLKMGADYVVNLNEEDFVSKAMELTQGAGVNVVVDSLGDTVLDRSFDAIAKLGHVVSIGETIGDPLSNLYQRLLARSLTFTRFHMDILMAMKPELWQQSFDHLCELILNDQLTVPIVETFELEDVVDMHRLLESRSVAGKLLLRVGK